MHEVRDETRPPRGNFEMYRHLMPHFWKLFRAHDGRAGILYGLTARGVLLLVGNSVHSFGPDEIELVRENLAPLGDGRHSPTTTWLLVKRA